MTIVAYATNFDEGELRRWGVDWSRSRAIIQQAMNCGLLRMRVIVAIATATAFEGLRAGAGTFRMVLDLPARTRIGPLAFAEFSRATDLSTTGIVFYVLFGVGGTLVTGATWLVAARGGAPRVIRRLLATASIASLLILVLTSQAAPLMWRIGTAPPDPALISNLLNRFATWTALRVVCADVSFLAVLSALSLAALLRRAAA